MTTKLLAALLLLAPAAAAAAEGDKKADAPAASASGPSGAKPAGGEAGQAQGDEEEKTQATNKIPTLEDRIRPVSGSLFVRKGRHELTPEIDVSLNDAFFQKYMFGLKYAYHPLESLAVGLKGVYGVSLASGNVNVCGEDGCNSPQKGDLNQTPGDISLIIGAEVAWAPLYGKLNLLGERVLHFDTFVTGGVDGIRYNAPANTPEDPATPTFTVGGNFGVGQHYAVGEFFTIRWDLRDYIYSGTRDVNGQNVGKIENQLMLEIGFSFFFPLHPSES